MPLYEFDCCDCGTFDAQRTVDDRDRPESCPECGKASDRILSIPNLGLMSPERRAAHIRNERSANEPQVSTRHRCGSGCGCGKKPSGAARRSLDVLLPGLGVVKKARKRNRPWMLGH